MRARPGAVAADRGGRASREAPLQMLDVHIRQRAVEGVRVDGLAVTPGRGDQLEVAAVVRRGVVRLRAGGDFDSARVAAAARVGVPAQREAGLSPVDLV